FNGTKLLSILTARRGRNGLSGGMIWTSNCSIIGQTGIGQTAGSYRLKAIFPNNLIPLNPICTESQGPPLSLSSAQPFARGFTPRSGCTLNKLSAPTNTETFRENFQEK